MDNITTVFQFELRYNHILNFSQIARKILSPYVRLADSISIDKQNTIEERIILDFGEDNYKITVSWDRIIINGQGELKVYINNNSPIETPFLNILESIKELDEFGSILNILFVSNQIKRLDTKKEKLNDHFLSKTIKDNVCDILENNSDASIILENKNSLSEQTITFGPYFGLIDLKKRLLKPININALGELDFNGSFSEYKFFRLTNKVEFQDFVSIVKDSKEIIKRLWKVL